jgi:hypothetical protein
MLARFLQEAGLQHAPDFQEAPYHASRRLVLRRVNIDEIDGIAV